MFSHILCFLLIADSWRCIFHRPIFQRENWHYNSPKLGSFGHSPLLRIHPPFWTIRSCFDHDSRNALSHVNSFKAKHVSFVIRLTMFRSSENTAYVRHSLNIISFLFYEFLMRFENDHVSLALHNSFDPHVTIWRSDYVKFYKKLNSRHTGNSFYRHLRFVAGHRGCWEGKGGKDKP